MIKNVVIVIETICIIGLVVVCVNFYNRLPATVVPSNESQTENLQGNKTTEIENKTENSMSKEYYFDADKMKVKLDEMTYEKAGKIEEDTGISVELDDGEAYLSTDSENEMLLAFLPNEKKDIEHEKITGFRSSIQEVYYGYFGNGDMMPILFFLMEDGTVEYIDAKEMIENKKYQSYGKVKDLKNIVTFADVSVTDEIGAGYRTVVAIDEDGYSYDINQLF